MMLSQYNRTDTKILLPIKFPRRTHLSNITKKFDASRADDRTDGIIIGPRDLYIKRIMILI